MCALQFRYASNFPLCFPRTHRASCSIANSARRIGRSAPHVPLRVHSAPLSAPSHTHLAALRPPQSHRTALYRPRHPPTRWHLHRGTSSSSVTAALGSACARSLARSDTRCSFLLLQTSFTQKKRKKKKTKTPPDRGGSALTELRSCSSVSGTKRSSCHSVPT